MSYHIMFKIVMNKFLSHSSAEKNQVDMQPVTYPTDQPSCCILAAAHVLLIYVAVLLFHHVN